MPSPFPGMDPYLEDPRIWPDVHHRLITVSSELLTALLRPKYYTRIEDRVYISDESDPGRSESTTLLADEIREPRLEVIDGTTRNVVTVIEVLSPTNKVPGSHGRRSFLEKRQNVMQSPTHWVEIDLLRGGERLPCRELLPDCEYLVHTSRVQRRPKGTIWPIRLNQQLPPIDIPLRDGDPDGRLDLQAVLTAVYDRAGYDLQLDYGADPCSPLVEATALWADRLLRSKGRRSANHVPPNGQR